MQNPQPGQYQDPSYLMNMMMSGYMMNMMTQLKESSFSLQTVLMFILMISIGEIKKIVLDLIEEGKKSIPIWCGQAKEWVVDTLSCRFRKQPVMEEFTNYVPEPEGHSITVSLTPNIPSLNALYKYITKENIGTISNQLRLTANSLQTSKTEISYSDCSFAIDENITMRLEDSLTFVVDNQTNAVVGSVEKSKGKGVIDIRETIFYKNFLLKKGEIDKTLNKEANKHTLEEWKTYINESMYIDAAINLISVTYSYTSIANQCTIIWKYIIYIMAVYYKDNYRNLTPEKIVYEYIAIISFYACHVYRKNFNIGYQNKEFHLTTESYNISFVFNTFYEFKNKTFVKDNNSSNGIFEDKLPTFPSSTSTTSTNTNTPQSKELTMYVSTNQQITGTDPQKYLYERFYDFYTNTILKASGGSEKKEITVYSIGYTTKETKQEKENPDYAEWKELMPKAEGEQAQGALVEYMKLKPQKTIQVVTSTQQIECQKVNTFYKNLNTLYLREDDKRRLLNIVDKFKNKKHLYDQLGIPHKLGMMFYGAPGTGKTTSIKAIASYLGKDLYFVNLKNVKKNAHLKEIFDHIHNNCNGGVVIFEDIDAMTTVVHKRFSLEEKPMTNVLEEANDDLTLSYLLNMLDGSLCKDGTIFALTTNHIENIDPALYRKGRVDMTIDFKRCDHYQFNLIYESIVGRPIPPELLKRIPENKYAPCDVIFHVYQYMLDTVDDSEVLAEFMEK